MSDARAKYVDFDAAVNGLAKIINESDMPEEWNKGMSAAMSVLFRIPAADVRPVITCGECKHSDTFSPDCTEATFPLKCLSIRYGGVYPNWFCEHGEKREES